MMKTLSIFGLLILCMQLVSSFLVANGQVDHRKQYIVYMGKHSSLNQQAVIDSNHDMLASIVGSGDHARNATIHHYHKTFRGFSAMLTPEQADQISRKESVVSVFESQIYHLQTVRSWDFLNAPANSIFAATANAMGGNNNDVIVGHVDSGIWPEAPSFRDEGLGPVPTRWRGGCWDNDVQCTPKVIGARYYYQGFVKQFGSLSSFNQRFYMSARDCFGHGTHTASTAVGAPVSIDDTGENIMRGGAPRARIAVYKVCWFDRCSCSDVLKAFDDAIYDGVDIITFSLGNQVANGQPTFMEDCMTVGALHAFQNGVLVSAAGGNFHDTRSVGNAAPWLVTVGATSTDRDYVTNVQLGDSQILMGFANNGNQMSGYADLVAAKDAAIGNTYIDRASSCNEEDALDYNMIYGKLVVCTTESTHDGFSKTKKTANVQNKGGVGVIIINGIETKVVEKNQDIPLATISPSEGEKLFAYMKSSNRPLGIILKSRINQPTEHEPTVPYFSSRGPGSAPGIIKPDLAAPGKNILAAYPPFENARPDATWYFIDAGTSMAAPHVTAVAALIKAIYPYWSPAEIKSALMTTAFTSDNSNNPIKTDSGEVATPYDLGSGLVNPNAALNPGLVYDFNMEDMVSYLCSSAIGINRRTLQGLLGYQAECPYNNYQLAPYNLNYPSIEVSNLINQTISVYRTVTYRGRYGDPTRFQVEIENPEGVLLAVQPGSLMFQHYGDKATFRVDITSLKPLTKDVFGSFTWFNDVHRVRSPIALQA